MAAANVHRWAKKRFLPLSWLDALAVIVAAMNLLSAVADLFW